MSIERYAFVLSYLNGASCRNASRKLYCSTSKLAVFLRILATSLVWREATSCFACVANFLVFAHFSAKCFNFKNEKIIKILRF